MHSPHAPDAWAGHDLPATLPLRTIRTEIGRRGMALLWHRQLIAEDVETAHRLLGLHQPVERHGRSASCASATHLIVAPVFPCAQVAWAYDVLAAEERGEIVELPSSGINGLLRVPSTRVR